MGVATKSRVKLETEEDFKESRKKARRLQITVSEKTWVRLLAQADEMGVSLPAYATMMVAQGAMQTEMTRANMPDILKGVGEEIGRRLPMEQNDE